MLSNNHAFVICAILFLTQSNCNGADEVKNNTATTDNVEVNLDTPRLVQDSYIAALKNSRKGAAKLDRASVVYAANQEPKIIQSITKPVVSAPVDLPVAKPIQKTVSTPQAPLVRREDNHYDTGPYAEPNSYNSYTATDGNYNGYNGYDTSGGDNSYSNSYLPNYDKYGPPKKYGPPHHIKPVYGPPDHGYGPPAPIYGAPLKPVYGIPYEGPSFFDKFKLKFDLFTLAKILLKIVIFKKIVKFIAIICLLLFIPKLIHIKKNKDEEEDRKITFNASGRTSEELFTLSSFVEHAINTYSQQQKGCENVGCRMMKVIERVDEEFSLTGISELFGNNYI